ncbi:unnamed protein product, partial [Ilex paraguariensis]
SFPVDQILRNSIRSSQARSDLFCRSDPISRLALLLLSHSPTRKTIGEPSTSDHSFHHRAHPPPATTTSTRDQSLHQRAQPPPPTK